MVDDDSSDGNYQLWDGESPVVDVIRWINHFISSLTYRPSPADVTWTQQAIANKLYWGIPSGGSVFRFNQDRTIDVRFHRDVTIREVEGTGRAIWNLMMLGMVPGSMGFIREVGSTEELVQWIQADRRRFDDAEIPSVDE
jgi:hypothetical protein